MSAPTLPEGEELERTLEEVEQALYSDLYEAAPPDLARDFGIAASRSAGELRLSAARLDHPFFNRVMGVGLETAPDPDRIAAHSEYFRSLGVSRFMFQLLPHVETEFVRNTMSDYGFERLRGWAKHLAEAESGSSYSSRATGLRIEAIDAAQSRPWAEICAEGFKLPAELRPWLAATFGRTGWMHYLALDGDEPAACAALYVHGPFATLGFAATRPDFQGRGAQSGLILRRLRDAASMGCAWIVSETDEELPDRPNPSYHNLVRLGLPVRYVRANWGPPKPG